MERESKELQRKRSQPSAPKSSGGGKTGPSDNPTPSGKRKPKPPRYWPWIVVEELVNPPSFGDAEIYYHTEYVTNYYFAGEHNVNSEQSDTCTGLLKRCFYIEEVKTRTGAGTKWGALTMNVTTDYNFYFMTIPQGEECPLAGDGGVPSYEDPWWYGGDPVRLPWLGNF